MHISGLEMPSIERGGVGYSAEGRFWESEIRAEGTQVSGKNGPK